MGMCELIVGCGFDPVEGGRFCARHDGKRPSTRVVWLLRGRECVIEETGGRGQVVVRFLDTRFREWTVARLLREPGGQPPTRCGWRRGEAMDQVLELLRFRGPLNVTALARERGVTLQATAKTLRRLETHGEVRRVRRGVYEAVAA